jgi:hypothetical protein
VPHCLALLRVEVLEKVHQSALGAWLSRTLVVDCRTRARRGSRILIENRAPILP